MNLKRNGVWLFPLLAVVSLPLWWSPVGRILAPRFEGLPATTSQQQPLNTFVLQRVAMTQNRAGKDEIFIKADALQSGQSGDLLQMSRVNGLLTGKARTLDIVGGEADYDTAREVLVLSDRVRLTSNDGYHLESEVLRYFPSSQQVKTAEAVRMSGPGLALRGKGLLYDLGTGDVQVGGRVVVDLS